ncbi:hypothetical protein GCM10009789_36720 [Kribbella sancticallisti]|uniref:Endonuclease/exonuclease/phosphatase domain-containing protein n=1 Tax=Kribbella sancticallisti TaxID=460087 RepID=A0ABP4PFX4_9ACTN
MQYARRRVVQLVVLALLAVGVAIAAPAAAAERDRLKISIANVAGAAKPPVGVILDTQKPHIMVISEAYRARAHLSEVADRYGYRLRQYGPDQGAEAPGIALLIKNGVTIKDRSLLKMSEPWWWKSGKRDPRRYPVVVVGVNGKTWHVVGVHFPPGGPSGGVVVDYKNRAAWIESRKAVQAYAANHPNAPVVAAGDFNATADECRSHFPGFLVAQGAKVDHALAKKDRGARFDDVIRHDAPNGMHGWITFKLSATPS